MNPEFVTGDDGETHARRTCHLSHAPSHAAPHHRCRPEYSRSSKLPNSAILRKSYRCSRTLSQSSEGDTAVKGAETLLLDDGVKSVGGVAVLWHIEWIGHGVVLSLEANLDDLHRSDNGDSLSNTGSETS